MMLSNYDKRGKSFKKKVQDPVSGDWYLQGGSYSSTGDPEAMWTRKACPPNMKMVFGKCRKTQKTRWKEQQAAQAKSECMSDLLDRLEEDYLS